MKHSIFLLVAALIATVTSFDRSSVNAAEINMLKADENGPVIADTVLPPAVIISSFNKKYPNATQVVWYRYVPSGTTMDWNKTLDENDYYVSFVMNEDEHVAWFDNGLWIRTSRTIDNTALPPAVSKAISKQYPGFIITDVEVETDDKITVYEVDLEKGNTKWVVDYAANGAVLKKKDRSGSAVTPTEVMLSDFDSRFPEAEAITWYRYVPRDRVDVLPSDWDYTLEPTDYEVRFRHDGIDYVAYYDNGSWIRTEAMDYNAAKLPSAVSEAIARDYKGYTIMEIELEQDAGNMVYEVELHSGKDKCKIHYNADGTVAKKKCKNGAKMKTKY